MSTDKDFFQLLPNPNVFVYNPVKKIEYTRARFENEYGFLCEYYVDWKAMVGDSSDNLKGAKGIGPKGATKLIHKGFMPVDGTEPDKLTKSEERYANLLLDNFEEFDRMRKVIRFYDIDKDELQSGKQKIELTSAGAMQDAMMQILSKYGFQRMIQRFSEFIAPFEQVFIKESQK
jgi:5'-3' exonuclease